MWAVITASEPSWIAPYSGLSPKQFGKLITVLRRGPLLAGAGRRVCRWKTGCCWVPRLADVTDLAAVGSLVRDLAVGRGPDREPARSLVRAAATEPLPPRPGADRGRHLGADTDHSVAEQFKTTATRPTTWSSSMPTHALSSASVGPCRQPQRLQGMGTVWSQELGRKHHRHRGRWLPRHRSDHPAPPITRPDRATGLEGSPQHLSPQSPRPSRAHLRPHEDLKDPPRLLHERRRRPPRHARHRPPPQPHPNRIADLRRRLMRSTSEITCGTALSRSFVGADT